MLEAQCVSPVTAVSDGIIRRAVKLRRQLHQIPELAYEEHDTSDMVTAELNRLGIRVQRGLAGGTGILAEIGHGSRCVALRADMDALPVTEGTNSVWRSRRSGLMHACGHDGHMAVLLGTAAYLAAQSDTLGGRVKLIFQPAEEGHNGALRMCEDQVLDSPPVQAIFGLHGWPELEVGHVASRPGGLLAAVDTITIVVHGVGTHSAYPHKGKNPIQCAASLMTEISSAITQRISPTATVVFTVGTFNAGQASNVVPDSATCSGTLRTMTAEVRRQTISLIREVSRTVAAVHGCRAAVELSSGTPATINSHAAYELFDRTARATLGKANVHLLDQPFLWSEDFAYYLRRVPGCFFILGTRPHGRKTYPMLHNSHYEFPDSAVVTGIRMMAGLALNFLAEN
ncbi:MAG: M20 metallopeptidase family protein [Phycisphaerae bacterium]